MTDTLFNIPPDKAARSRPWFETAAARPPHHEVLS
jgi:hypothetical protein